MTPDRGPYKTLLKINIIDYDEEIICEDFTIEKLSLQEQLNYFDLESFELDENKNVRGWKPKNNTERKAPDLLESFSREEIDELIGSEYYVYTKTFQDASILIETLRLYKLGYIVATHSESLNFKIAQFHYPRYVKVHKAGLLEININELEEIDQLFKALKKLEDKKVKLNLERFKESPKHYHHSFINLVGILESLLTGNNSGELKYRFSLNTNYVLKKAINSSSEIDFNTIKQLYDIRSSLVHTGESKKFTKDKYLLLRQITQEILIWFVYHPEYYVEEEILKELFQKEI